MSVRSVAALALGALILVPGAPAVLTAQWQPDRFQLFCGTAFAFSTSEQWLNVLRAEGLLDSYHAKDYRNYLENLGRELDEADPGCVDAERLDEMEDMATHALHELKSVGGAQGLQFTDPAPVRLGPVVLDEEGSRAVRLYVDPELAGIGQTDLRKGPGGRGIDPASVAHVRFGVEHMRTQPAWSRYRTIAHELFHVVQSAQQVRADAAADGDLAPWINDGTADAVAADLTRRRGYGVEPPLSVRGSRSYYGLRPYHRSLTWVSGSSDQDQYGNLLVTDYTASSFWTYLAERFFDGSFHYLIDWFAVPDPHAGRDDWLEWVDDLLRFDQGGIDQPLYLVFPDFIANYASWGEKKYAHIGEETWRIAAFDECEVVPLFPGDPPVELTLELEPLSARCVKVMAGGLDADDAIAVQFMAYDGDTDRLDNLHLTASSLTSTVGGVTFDCYDESKRAGPRTLCLQKPFVGAQGRTLSPSDGGGVTASSGGFVKTWLGVEQMAGREGLVENTYFLVHTPVEPRDAEHDVQRNSARQTVRLEVGLERSTIAMASGPQTASAAVNGSAGLGLVPMRGGDAAGGGPFDLAGMITAATDAATDPDAMSRGLFLQNQPMGTILPGPGGDCEGVCMVTVEQKEPRANGWGGHELVTVAAVSLTPENPIPWGATGSFKAMVSACPAEECDGALGIGEGTITVTEFSAAALHMTVSGSYCVIRGLSGILCRERQDFEADVVKPFGWAYDAARTFRSIDTPGMAEYRENLSKALAELMPGSVTAWRKQQDRPPGEDPLPGGDSPAPEGPPAPAGGGGVVAPTCDCSCEGHRALMEEIAAYEAEVEAYEAAVKRGEKDVKAPPARPPVMQTALQCSRQCAAQWGSCESGSRR